MITKFINDEILYSGEQLNGLFAYQELRAGDDSLIAFTGAADVKDELVDFEDRLNNDCIKAEKMLHFILTIHGNDLYRARLWQLLLVQKAFDAIQEMYMALPYKQVELTAPFYFSKSGDDIYIVIGEVEHKLSVSIATLSSNQKELVHLALNISDAGAPVRTYSLNKLGINALELGTKILDKFLDEYEGIKATAYKVKGVM